MSDLITHLLAEPYKYGLFQAISLLERYAAQVKSMNPDELSQSVQIKANVSMAFPAADIHAIEQDEVHPDRFKLYTPLLSLAGVTGPLPQVFTELLLTSRKNKDTAPLDFLDIFNHRLISLLYQVKQKYHLALGVQALQQMPLLQFVDAVSSSGAVRMASSSIPHTAWLRHASLQGPAPRAMEGLVNILRDRLGIRFKSQQFFGVWLSLEAFDHAALGQHPSELKKTRLGLNAALGQRAWDQSAAILLTAKQLSLSSFLALLPGQLLHQRLKWLVDRHQSSPRKVCVELSMDVHEYQPVGLGLESGPRLGLSSWLLGPPAFQASGEKVDNSLQLCRFWLRSSSQTDAAIKAVSLSSRL